MRFMLLAVLIVFSLFAAQLLRLQAIDAKTMAEAALGQRLQKESIPALRGDITDADGVVLASSEERRDITADPTAVAQYTKVVDGTRTEVGISGAAKDLAPLLHKSARNIAIRLRANPGTRFTYLVKNVSPLTWHKVAALGIPGILSERTTQRDYPTNDVAASLVGWVGNDGKAGGGVEQMLDKKLTGTPGEMTYERSGDGSVIATGEHTDVPAVPGQNVRLTINSDLQFMAQNTLAQEVIKSRSESGTVVVSNPKGDLLAVASYPSFDPNHIGQAQGFLGNRAFSEVFEPGSTAKVMTAAAAIEEGVATPRTHVTVPSVLQRADREFRDAEKHGRLHLTFAGVLAHSSNMGAILVGEKLSKQTMYDYLRKFGIGSHTGVGFPGESRGLLAKPQDWDDAQRFTILYGQGMSVNAIQDAGVFQTIANGGVRVPPRLIAGTESNGQFNQNPRAKGTRVVSEATAQQVTHMLEGVVGKHGTAPAAEVKGYRVAGKTGTASRYDAATGGYNGYTASFIGFAPADNPQLIVSVTLQNPKSSIYGGVVAAPVFSKVMTYALQAYKIPPTGTNPSHIPLTFKTPAEQARAKGKNE
jgi:cell division protein FtsI (penicillin-binding protein 3)